MSFKYPEPTVETYAYRHDMPFVVKVNRNEANITVTAFKSTDIVTNFCEHIWQKYEGLTEKYEYCTKCDQKYHF